MPFNSALSGLQASSENLKILGNNIANTSTIGFKKSRGDFSDVYASSALGASSNAIGTGVKLSSVSQQFTQGTINSADTNLDLAINGAGFFVLNDFGATAYTRAGAFGVDKDGYITNSERAKLQGYLGDENGNISGATGDLKIENSNITPKLTSAISISLNFDASAKPPAAQFLSGFTPDNPPAASTFNNSSSTRIYDSLGKEHLMTTYFVKAPAVNTWRVYVGIDGTDVTTQAAATPVGSPPQEYGAGNLAAPFTVVFNSAGNFVVNDTGNPTRFYGPTSAGNVNSTAVTFPKTSGTVPILELNELTINGVPVDATTSGDAVSTTDVLASSIAISSAINRTTALHGVTATPNANTLDLTSPTFSADALAASNFRINGIDIEGVMDNMANALGVINGYTNQTGIVATDNGGSIQLTAADGRNIQVETDGAVANTTFSNFGLDGGSALDQVQIGTYQLTTLNNLGITIGGTQPTDANLIAGAMAGIIQPSSDIITIPNWDPSTGAISPQPLSIDLSSSSQYASPFSVRSLTQDGYSTGRLTGIDVDSSGLITARYSNGQAQSLGQVLLANFQNTQGLQSIGDTTWSETFSSGVALLGAPGTGSLGLIQSGVLEDSNVELTAELVALIVAQRNFQANAQTIRTADAVQQTIINIR